MQNGGYDEIIVISNRKAFEVMVALNTLHLIGQGDRISFQ